VHQVLQNMKHTLALPLDSLGQTIDLEDPCLHGELSASCPSQQASRHSEKGGTVYLLVMALKDSSGTLSGSGPQNWCRCLGTCYYQFTHPVPQKSVCRQCLGQSCACTSLCAEAPQSQRRALL